MAVRRKIARGDGSFRPGQAEHQKRGREIEAGDHHIDEAKAEDGEQTGAGQRAGDARAVLGRARNADGAHKVLGRHDLSEQRAADAEIGRADQSHESDDDHDAER